MRLSRSVLGCALMAIPSFAFGQPQPLGTLWRNTNGSIILTECPAGGDHDEQCRAVSARSGETIVVLGGGYERVTLL